MARKLAPADSDADHFYRRSARRRISRARALIGASAAWPLSRFGARSREPRAPHSRLLLSHLAARWPRGTLSCPPDRPPPRAPAVRARPASAPLSQATKRRVIISTRVSLSLARRREPARRRAVASVSAAAAPSTVSRSPLLLLPLRLAAGCLVGDAAARALERLVEHLPHRERHREQQQRNATRSSRRPRPRARVAGEEGHAQTTRAETSTPPTDGPMGAWRRGGLRGGRRRTR